MQPKTSRSRESLIRAINDVLDESAASSDVGRLSITELCTSAGVSRPTFYQHFTDVSSLVEASAVERMRVLFDSVVPAPPGDEWEQAVPRVIRELLDGLFDHANFFHQVLTGASARSFQARVVGFLTERMLDYSPLGDAVRAGSDRQQTERYATFLAAGTTWLVVGWLLDDGPRPTVGDAADEIAELLLTGIASHRGIRVAAVPSESAPLSKQ